MASIQKKVNNALLTIFSPDELHLEKAENDKVIGYIISDKFLNLDDEGRQDMLWELLRKHLNTIELSRIIALIALTHEEDMAYSS